MLESALLCGLARSEHLCSANVRSPHKRAKTMQSCSYATDTNANTDADTVFGNQQLMSADVRCRQ